MKNLALNMCPNSAFELFPNILCEQELFDHAQIVLSDYGFEFCQYILRQSIPISRPTFIKFDNFPVEWRQLYQDNKYIDIDPTVNKGLISVLPVLWSNELFESAQQLREDSRTYGLNFGVTLPFHDPDGSTGLLTLVRKNGELTREELTIKHAPLILFGQIMHCRMKSLIAPKLAPEHKATLTCREKAVLLWTGEGKTSFEISAILGISERTVNFHLNNSVSKLEACNKLHATVKAALLGKL